MRPAVPPLPMSGQELAAIIAAIAALVTAVPAALIALLRQVHELRADTRRIASAALSTADRVSHELSPNSGTSVRDAVDRTEGAAGQVLGRLDELSDDIGGIRRDLGRLADADAADRAAATTAHQQIHDRITRLENR